MDRQQQLEAVAVAIAEECLGADASPAEIIRTCYTIAGERVPLDAYDQARVASEAAEILADMRRDDEHRAEAAELGLDSEGYGW